MTATLLNGRYNSAEPMTRDELYRAAPAVFAPAPNKSRSEKYQYLPTIKIVEGMEREGFSIYGATQTVTRDPSRQGHSKHLLRFRKAGDFEARGAAPEVILINSHDGSSAYQIMSGMFRFACANGLICGDTYKSVHVPHIGHDAISNIIDGSFTVVKSHDKALGQVERWQDIQLAEPEAEAFAAAAIAVRFEPTDDKPAPITPAQMLRQRRRSDNGSDLWTTYNRIQENAIRGGLRGFTRNSEGRVQRRSTRAVKGIDQSTALNRALWALTEQMEALKAA